MSDSQGAREERLRALLDRYPEDETDAHRDWLHDDGTLPQFAFVSLYERRSWEGARIVLCEADEVEERIAVEFDGLTDGGWSPTTVVDLDSGHEYPISEQRVGFSIEGWGAAAQLAGSTSGLDL